VDERAAKRERLVAEAFGDGVPEERRREARAALARFDGRPEPQDPAPVPPPERRRRRPAAVAVVAAALVVGAAVGVAGTLAAVHGSGSATAGSGTGSPQADPTATGDPAATSRLAAGDPASVASPVQAADALLAQSRTTDDDLPTLEAADSRLRADTSHLVFTSAQGEKLYIASGSGVNIGYCLVAVSDAHAFGGAEGTVRCAPIRAFSRDGITYPSAGYTAHWVGGSVEITVTGQG
jgi:hypothetical protein